MQPELTRLARRVTAAAAALAMGVAGLVLASPAIADTQPLDTTLPQTVSSDALPTAQIDGIAWDQKIAGDTVYVGGRFTSVRPAGAAPGTGTTPRSHMMAYDIRTGQHTGFAPTFNAQVRQLAVSPDGRRVYAVGEFTSVNGTTMYRIAAFDTATGALITSFRPAVNARIASIAVTNTTVYIGGIFTTVGNQPRTRIAAVNAANGAVLPPIGSADNGQVAALVLSPDGSQLVVGGSFTSFNASTRPGYGLARVDTATGAMLPLPANELVRNGGANASITSLSADGDMFYGSGYVFGSGGNLEGTFAAGWDDGAVRWIEDCHGDTYQSAPVGDVIYSASHKHYCGNIGGFPETTPRSFQRATATTTAARGVVTKDPLGYPNWAGNARPELLNWFPDLDTGTFSGANQGPWAVAGDDRYVVMSGEFQRVNNVGQQGLVRFAVPAIAPNSDGPRLSGAAFNPRVRSVTPGEVRITWPGNHDRDNATLTYRLYRTSSVNTPPIFEETVTAPFWATTNGSFVDRGLPPGSTQRYRITATDPRGNVAQSEFVSVTVPAAQDAAQAYAATVLGDGASSFWRLGEPAGTTVSDWAGLDDAVTAAGTTRGAAGAITGDAATAFDGTTNGYASTRRSQPGRNTLTVEAWIRTTTTTGGKIVGFGSSATGSSASFDRMLYMDNAGKVLFGVYPGVARTVSSTEALNDGQWHHVVGTLGSTGMRLYVDSRLVGTRTDTTTGQAYSGFWRIGGDNISTGWTGSPTSKYFKGAIDEVAVYPTALAHEQVLDHYTGSGRTSVLPAVPADPYGAAVRAANPSLFWRLGDTSGTQATDTGLNQATGTYRGAPARGAAGAIPGVAGAAGAAVELDGVDDFVSADTSVANPRTYSQEIWFSTRTTAGGRLIGFGNSRDALSTSYDRMVYLEADGRVSFGVNSGTRTVVTSPTAYNDGGWHHVVATQSAAGMRLYLDGALVAQSPVSAAQNYTGYWRVGGDRTWGTGTWFAGSVDEAAVYSSALTPETVAQHFAAGTTGLPAEPPNQAPVAAFTPTVAGLTVQLDASASTDSDGAVTSYAWTFGDGTTGTGATTSRTYAAPGTYTVGLTVTDDDGASSTTTRTVVVTAPAPANAAPTAAFTASVDGLAASLDASGSRDTDGTLASYRWDFGDGAQGTGVRASHTFAQPGSYTVRLTVTDDRGATAVATSAVTVTAAGPPAGTALAFDAFARTSTSGWGGADLGGAWSLTGGATQFSVGDGVGRQRLAGGANLTAALGGVSSTDTEVQARVSVDKPGSGTGLYVSVIGRRVGADDYRARLRFYPTGAVVLQTMRGATTLDAVTVAGLAYVPGDVLQVRVQVTGTAPTTVRAKVWKAGDAEPAAWRLTSTDGTAALQAPGGVGLGAFLSATATNAPVIATFDELWVGAPGATPGA